MRCFDAWSWPQTDHKLTELSTIYMDDLQTCQTAMICLSTTEIVLTLIHLRTKWPWPYTQVFFILFVYITCVLYCLLWVLLLNWSGMCAVHKAESPPPPWLECPPECMSIVHQNNTDNHTGLCVNVMTYLAASRGAILPGNTRDYYIGLAIEL